MNILFTLFVIGWIVLFVLLFGRPYCKHPKVIIKKKKIKNNPPQYLITHQCVKCNRIVKKYKT